MGQQHDLTKEEWDELHRLEAKLKECTQAVEFSRAKQVAGRLQSILKGSGRTTRWMQNLNWLCECAIEAGEVSFAQRRLEIVQMSVGERTRCHLEASAMLAVCYLRQGRLDEAKPLITFVFDNLGLIRSEQRREQFRRRFTERAQGESILSSLMEETADRLEPQRVQTEAEKLVTKDESELIETLGQSVPREGLLLLEGTQRHLAGLLPAPERLLLPARGQKEPPQSIGKKTLGALHQIIWKTLCDPSGKVYRHWIENPSKALGNLSIAAGIIAACKSWHICSIAAVAPLVALAMRMGAKKCCHAFKPNTVMIGLSDRD